jgi:hypothetical protein
MLLRDHPVIEMLFEVFREFTNEKRGKLIAFVSGVPTVPAEGFGLYASSGHPFTIGPSPRFSHVLETLWLPRDESRNDMSEETLLRLRPDVNGLDLIVWRNIALLFNCLTTFRKPVVPNGPKTLILVSLKFVTRFHRGWSGFPRSGTQVYLQSNTRSKASTPPIDYP